MFCNEISIFFYHVYSLGFGVRTPVFGGFANNKGADQHAHPRKLISAFVIRFLDSIISKQVTSDILISS